MKTNLFLFFLIISLTACSKKIAVVALSNPVLQNEASQKDAIDFEIVMAHQTKHNIGFEIFVTNRSGKDIYIDPIDFYYVPEDYAFSVDALDPNFIHYQVDHPLEAIAEASERDWQEANGLGISLTLLSEVYVETAYGGVSLSGLRFLRYWAQVKDYKKVLLDELLQPQYLATGESISRLIYFPKKDMKKMDATFIHWERADSEVQRKFLVQKNKNKLMLSKN